jgi:hypothetical protein
MLGYFAIYTNTQSDRALATAQDPARRRRRLGWLPHEIGRLNRR